MEATGEIGELEAQGESPPLFDQATFVFGGRTTTARQRSAPASPSPSPSPPPTQGHAAAAAFGSSSSNKRGRVPASNKAILGLQEVTTTSSTSECAICLQDLDDPPADPETPLRLRAMPCSHTFHQHCIFEWLRRNAVCPLCRHPLPTEEDEQEQGRRRSRVVYDEEEDRHYMVWHYMDHPMTLTDEEQEQPPQERTVTRATRGEYTRWLELVAQNQLRTTPQS